MVNNKIQNEGNLELCVCFFACYSRDRKLVCFFLLHCHLNIIDKKRELNALNSIEAKVCFCRCFFSIFHSILLCLSLFRIVKPHEHCDTNALHSTKQTIAVDCCVVACDFVFSGKNIQRDNQFMIWNCSNGNAQVSRNVGGFFLQRWLNSIWRSPNSNRNEQQLAGRITGICFHEFICFCGFFSLLMAFYFDLFLSFVAFFHFCFFSNAFPLTVHEKRQLPKRQNWHSHFINSPRNFIFFHSVHVPFDFAVYLVIFSFFPLARFLMSVTWAANQR